VIAAWMLYALLTSLLLAAAAWLLEGAVRLRGGPSRLPWLAALLATAALVALVPLRSAGPAPLLSAVVEAAEPADQAGSASADGAGAIATLALAAMRTALARPLNAAAELGAGAAGTALGAGWLLLSAALLSLAAATVLRARRARRAWPGVTIAGERVRVAPHAGPAVLGIVHPQVVIPAWLLDASADEQRLVVMHEREHVRARDPLVLAAGWLAVALVPWSPAAWWMLIRLRAAVEVDCDARVLRRGVARHAYGTLLIDMAGRGPGLSLGAPGLAGSPSTLERRILSMNARLPRFARLRAGLLGVLGLALVAGACESPLPTSAEVARMDAAAVEARAIPLRAAGEGDLVYFIDGRQATRAEAHALPADRITRVEVSGAREPLLKQIHLYTTAAAESGASAESRADAEVLVTAAARDREGGAVRVTTSTTAGEGSADGALTTATARFDGLLVIDGVVSDEAGLRRLDPDDIATVDIVKGDAAATLYDDPRAAKGVIRITTKAGTNR